MSQTPTVRLYRTYIHAVQLGLATVSSHPGLLNCELKYALSKATGPDAAMDDIPNEDQVSIDALIHRKCNVLMHPCSTTAFDVLQLRGWVVPSCQRVDPLPFNFQVEQCRCSWHALERHSLCGGVSLGDRRRPRGFREAAVLAQDATSAVLLFAGSNIGFAAFQMAQPSMFRLHSCFMVDSARERSRSGRGRFVYDFGEVIGGSEAQDIYIC